MTFAQVPFECPECGRAYHAKVDLMKLRRLNRMAVCGKCGNKFTVSIHFRGDSLAPSSSDRPPPPTPVFPSEPPPAPGPQRSPSAPRMAAARSASRNTRPIASRPPPSPSERPMKSDPPKDSYPPTKSEPPMKSEPPPRRSTPPTSSDPPPASIGARRGWPTSSSRPQRGSKHRWPRASKSARGIEWRPRSGSQPPLDEEVAPVSQSRPAPAGFPDLEIDLPPKKKRREIVVEVADTKSGKQRRNRQTYKPRSLIEGAGDEEHS